MRPCYRASLLPMKKASVTIREATGDQEMATARRLFQDYAAWLGIDLGFQSFDEELATLPGPYAAPSGLILLAEREGLAIGCVALRKIADAVGEVKRLYVSPRYQGGGDRKTVNGKCYRRSKRAALRPHNARYPTQNDGGTAPLSFTGVQDDRPLLCQPHHGDDIYGIVAGSLG